MRDDHEEEGQEAAQSRAMTVNVHLVMDVGCQTGLTV